MRDPMVSPPILRLAGEPYPTRTGISPSQRDRHAQARPASFRDLPLQPFGREASFAKRCCSQSRSAGFIEREVSSICCQLVGSIRLTTRRETMMTRIAPYVIAALALGLSACTNPYDPVQRGLGGGLLGAASGAAIGAAAGGGPGAALGAAIGGATGIVGGVATTPPPPPGTYYGYPASGYPAYGYPGYAQPGYG